MNCCILGYKAIGLFIVFSTEALAEEVHRLATGGSCLDASQTA